MKKTTQYKTKLNSKYEGMALFDIEKVRRTNITDHCHKVN